MCLLASRRAAATVTVVAAALAISALAPGAALAPRAANAQSTEPVGVGADRLAGGDRYATARRVALATFDSADVAILAAGHDYADALAAAYAGGVAQAPVLLTGRERLPEHTDLTLRRLETQRVVLVGGRAALDPSLAGELESRGLQVERVAGADRFATAAAVAKRWGDADTVGTLKGQRTALLANGRGFADALAAGPVAAGAQLPLLLTTPESTTATATAIDAMESLNIQRAVIVGGEEAVSPAVADRLADRGLAVERWAGRDRLHTARTVAAKAVQELGFDAQPAVLARGGTFADALTASVHAGTANVPVLLTGGDALGAPTTQWLADHCGELAKVRAVGGAAAIAPSVLNRAAETAEACRDDVDRFRETSRQSPGLPPGWVDPQLTEVRLGLGQAQDRVEWHLAGDRAAWRVEWVQRPTRGQGPKPLQVEGEAYLAVTLFGRAQWGGNYQGPQRFDVNGANVAEVVLADDFEGTMRWIIGLQRRAPFAAQAQADPNRFVVDVTRAP
jgi:putative cell wall-binding protein